MLLITNPIDDQGFCTAEEKGALVRRFVDEIAVLIQKQEIRLIVKLHAGERQSDYEQALRGSIVSEQVAIRIDEPLYPLLGTADAAVIMASTVGLEALLFGLPLGVLELPGAGFVFDYVAEKAAMGLSWSKPMAAQVRNLLHYDSPEVGDYLNAHLARLDNAAETVCGLIVDMVSSEKPSVS